MPEIAAEKLKNLTFKWTLSSAHLRFSADGKHEIAFSPDFPLTLDSFIFSAHYPLTPSYHNYLEICYVYEGNGIFTMEDQSVPVQKGDMFIVGPHRMHLLEALPRQKIKMLVAFFLPDLIYHPGIDNQCYDYVRLFQSSSKTAFILPGSNEQNGLLLQLMCSMFYYDQNRRKYYQWAIRNALCEILLILLNCFDDRLSAEDFREKNKLAMRRLETVFSFIHQNFQDPTTINQLAKSAHMSPAYLSRYFSKTVGMTLMEYIQRFRIDKAKDMLIHSGEPITQVAFLVGFDSLNYFDRIFKRYTHLSPSEFRHQYLE